MLNVLEADDLGGGSEAGVLTFLFTDSGVTSVGFEILAFPPLSDPRIRRASFLKGDMEREIPLFSLPSVRETLGGVARYPEVLDPASLSPASAARRIFRTFSSSVSVRAIRSRRLVQRCADSEWRRKVSPFLVTLSRTPRSMMERTLEVAGI